MPEHKEIFISYGREEGVTDFVRKLCTDLRKAGFSVWLDVDIPLGSDWPNEIGLALKHCKILIAIMTKKYVCESIYCRNELYDAVEKGKRVFPVRYGDDSEWKDVDKGDGIKYMIKGLNYVKFQPNVDDYSSFLAKLIKAMNPSKIVEDGEPTKNGEDEEPGMLQRSINWLSRHYWKLLLSVLVAIAATLLVTNTGRGVTEFNENFTADDLYQYLQSNNVPKTDCDIIIKERISGLNFMDQLEKDWSGYGVSEPGITVIAKLQGKIKKEDGPPHEPDKEYTYKDVEEVLDEVVGVTYEKMCRDLIGKKCNKLIGEKTLDVQHIAMNYFMLNTPFYWHHFVGILCNQFDNNRLASEVAKKHGVSYKKYCQ